MTIPDLQLDEWQQITDAATEGPWQNQAPYFSRVETVKRLESEVFEGFADHIVCEVNQRLYRKGQTQEETEAQVREREQTVRFIAEARSMVPQLLEEVRRLRKWVKVLGENRD